MESKHKPIFSQFLATGSGGSGQLLLGDLEDYTTFLPVDPNKVSPEDPAQTQNFFENLVYISLGGTKGLGLTNQGEVYSWGETTGKTGDKVNIEPVQVLKSPLKVLKISCGWAHNICLTDASQVYVWGEGKFGQLGQGKERMTYISDPTRLDIDTNFKLLDVKAGFRQSYIITNQNQVLCCGSNKSLELGKETEEGVIASPLVLDLTEIIQHEIAKMSTGQRHVVVMDSAGDLYGWGDNKYGQLGYMSEKKKAYSPVKLGIEKIREISCGWNHTLALSEEREAYITGRGNFGQQGNGKKEDAVGFHQVEIKKDAKIKHIVSGSEASYVVTEEDEIYVWGWNEHGNLGTGNKEDSDIPVKLEIDSKGKDPTLFCGGAAVILAASSKYFLVIPFLTNFFLLDYRLGDKLNSTIHSSIHNLSSIFVEFSLQTKIRAVFTTIKLTSHHMKLAHPKEHYLVQTESHGKISYCYHLDYLAKMRPATFDIQHPFRIICSSCHIALATELTSKERIFALERMKNYAVKYLLFTKGCIKVGTLMRTKKLKSLWTDPFIERFLKVFEHKENSEDMHEDLLWCLKNLEFDQDIYKFAVNSPYYQQQFLPKRNINMIDVRYVLERLLSVHIIYHKIANPEYKLNDGEMPAAMPQMELVDIVEMPEEPEPIIEPPPQKEEVKYEPVHLLYERKGRLEVENMAPYSALRVNNEWDGKDLTDREFEQEIKALKIIYPDFICFGVKTTHALIETNMDNITYKLPVLKEIVLKCPLQGGLETSFSKRMYFIYESKPVRMFFLVYPRPGAGLKEWVIHSTELFTSGVNIQDKPNVEKCITLREKFLVGLNKVLKDLIPKNIFIPTGHTVFPKTTNHLKEHFGTLGEKILPSQYPKRACLSVIKKSLENWENFSAARNFTITIEDIAQAAERYPHKGMF